MFTPESPMRIGAEAPRREERYIMAIIRRISRRKKTVDSNYELLFKATRKLDDQGRNHVALYSEFFSNLSGRVMCTNAAYADLKNEINASIEFCDPKEKIVLDIFEPSASSEFDREAAIIGYRRYITACYRGYLRMYSSHLFLFLMFLLIGVLMLFLMYGTKLFAMPVWAEKVYDSAASVFIWQFIAYMAFEWSGERKQLQRLDQMRNLEFEFKLWE